MKYQDHPIIGPLTKRRAELIAELDELLNKVKSEDRGFSLEEDQKWADTFAALDELDVNLAEQTEREDRAAAAALIAEKYNTPTSRRTSMNVTKISDEEAAVRDWLRGKGDRILTFSLADVENIVDPVNGTWEVRGGERRDLTTTTGTATIPAHTRALLYEHLVANSAIRQTNATILRTDDGNDLKLPKTTSAGTAAIVGEGTALAEADPAFGSVTLGAWKYGQFVQVTNELIEDTAVALLPFLARDAGRALGNASGLGYVVGTGVNEPLGVMVAAGTGVTGGTGQAGVPTSDELVDLFFSVAEPYRRNAYWLMNDSTFKAVRKLKDSYGAYRLGSLSEGGANKLLGRPVVTDPNVAATGTNNISLAFGDFGAYFIRDVNEIRWERNDGPAFQSDVVSFRSILRTDGDLLDLTGAIKSYVGGPS